MQIQNDQQFYCLLHAKGIDILDYYDKSDMLRDAIGTHDGSIIDYIIKNCGKDLDYNCLVEALYLKFGQFKRLLAAKSDDINLEDLAIDCVRICGIKEIEKFMELLFEKYKVDPNGKTGMIFTEGCHYGNLKAVKYLIETKHVDPNINDEMGYIFAVRFECYAVAKYLVEHGAKYKAKNCLALKLLQKDRGYTSKDKEWLLNCYKEAIPRQSQINLIESGFGPDKIPNRRIDKLFIEGLLDPHKPGGK